MSRKRLGLIVEGKGEVKALPVLVRRILTSICPRLVAPIPSESWSASWPASSICIRQGSLAASTAGFPWSSFSAKPVIG